MSVRLVLDIRKSLEENAAGFFDAAKKARSKATGARKAIESAQKSIDEAAAAPAQKKPRSRILRKKSWFEKFKWFFASNGMLVLAGRDATTNEILIKKHLDDADIVFHTDAAGSPFVVVKAEGKPIAPEVIQEAADFCACHSRAWKMGISGAEVYWVAPDQVTKEAKAGEFMQKGGFMVYGKRNYVRPSMELLAFPYEDKVMVCPASSVRTHPVIAARITVGEEKPSDAAKKVVGIFKGSSVTVDDVLPCLPAGGCKVVKVTL
jgi:predicted ribosome quality control (RQC) complex YloA/Tae2 family protein